MDLPWVQQKGAVSPWRGSVVNGIEAAGGEAGLRGCVGGKKAWGPSTGAAEKPHTGAHRA